jgi:ankyrin repeat protein
MEILEEQYKPQMVKEYLYVTPLEGLSLRIKPSLMSEKLDIIPFRTRIEINEINNQHDVIDGIDNFWKKTMYNNKTGWVFGGYLTDRDPINNFIVGKWTVFEEQFRSNVYNNNSNYQIIFPARVGLDLYYIFEQDGSFSMGLPDSGYAGSGTWNINNSILRIEGHGASDDHGFDFSLIYSITLESRNRMILTGDKNRLAMRSNVILRELIKSRDRNKILEYCKVQNDLNEHYEHGITPLMYALIEYNEEAALIFLENGSNVNDVDDYNSTPLHYACKSGFVNVINYLLDHGADINAKDNFNQTPLDCTFPPYYKFNEFVDNDIGLLLKSYGAEYNKVKEYYNIE